VTTIIVNGFFVGLVYGLFGVGLVVVYRGARAINFAYGETGMIAAFVFAELWVDHGVTMLVALPLALTLSIILGGATEWLVVRPLQGKSRLSVMVGTFGVAALLLVYAGRRWGLNPRSFPPLVNGVGWRLAGLTIAPTQILILIAAVGVLAALGALYRYTSFGLRLRATAIDPYAAELVGVHTDRTSFATWALAGGLAGGSAILIAPLVAVHPYFMTLLFVRGVAAALVGGLTSIGGAFGAGIALGVAEAVIAYTSPVTGISEVAISLLIIGFLLVRPSGLVRSAY
jgi:branched-chain amino acid transport system permease protein